MKVLVTGGAGYIGSHFVKQLIENGYKTVVVDNLSRGHKEAIHPDSVHENASLLDFKKLSGIISNHKPDAIVHFAAFAYVGESVENPALYYENNVIGSFNLIRASTDIGVNNFVFSSTCSIYGNPEKIPIDETQKSNPINPYANTKLTIEKMLDDFESAYGLRSVSLRYFNAAGADPDSNIGESHNPEPHLIPIVLQVALGKRGKVFIYGNDYDTPDGTCIRDYIHVNDLAEAHIKALEFLIEKNKSEIINLGTGYGNSVLEIIQKSEKITGRKVNYEFVERRKGDPAVLVADNKKAFNLLNWKPEYSIEDIISSAWKWHQNQKY
ncbi:MAG: UDP-glucose 4-epimerase GalE [Melioribacteraceae bacterium]|nr:UDP-glucose 4-epimerase GalE [Melioribacteraceae bacterium]